MAWWSHAMAVIEKIFTIGHGGLALKEFLRRLQARGIAMLVDVRRFPVSKRHPHFSRAALAGALKQCEINYRWLGEKLGGYRNDGYETYAATDAFRNGSAELLRLAQRQPTAFMCAELDYRACHRRFIAAFLQQQGVEVWHIDKNGELLSHVEAEAQVTMQIPF
jgi:uncharacterized protein (DUF488 family)